MAKNKISEFSSTPANNTDIGGIDIAEGCAPSGINNAIRELMAQLKDQQVGTDADNFTVGGNLSVTGTSTFTGAITAGVIGATTLTTTGNTILGDSTADTLNVGNGGLIKDANGTVGIGIIPNTWGATSNKSLQLGGSITLADVRFNNYYDGTIDKSINAGYAGTSYFDTVIGKFIFQSSDNYASGANVGVAPVVKMTLDNSANLIILGATATKASGTTWANPSDIRLKDNVIDYAKGLSELMQVNVKEWTYNGKGGTTKNMKGIGVIADEVMTVLPNTVDTYQAKLNFDDENETDIKKFDATEITWLMLNSIKEQQAMINELSAKVAALEAK